MTLIQAIVSIAVALIAGTTGGGLVFAKFLIERRDKKEELSVQKQIDDAINAARKDITKEIKEAVQQGIVDCGTIGDKAIRQSEDNFVQKLEEGLKARGEEGRERFEINSKQINENSSMIKEILVIQKDQTEKMGQLTDSITSLAQVSEACAESQRNSNYDRLLIVTNKIIKNNVMTITEKTNLTQLYDSWKKLQGHDPKIDTLYGECIKVKTVLDN
jgi:hypothetical protein